MDNDLIIKDLRDVADEPTVSWDKLSGSNVLITGATGFIGSLLIRTLLLKNRLHKANIKILACARNREKCKTLFNESDEIKYVIGDITDPFLIEDRIDYVIHTASVTTSKVMVERPVETIETTVEGTKNLLEFAKEKDAKGVVYLSSMEVYGITATDQNPIFEDMLGYVDLTKVRSSYPEGKRICELMCNCYHAEYGLPVTIARLAQTFGIGIPKSDNRAPIQFAKSACYNRDIVLHTTGKSISNFCYSTDLIKAILILLTEGARGEAYNVSNEKETRSVAEIAELVSSINGNIRVVYEIPDSNIFGYAPDVTMRLSSEKLQSLGWRPRVSMKEAYIRLIDYLMRN